MRTQLCGVAAILVGAVALAQPAPVVPARYGVAASVAAYPQGSPKEALASAIKALDRSSFDTLAAHLLDPKLVDDRVTERAKTLEDGVEKELRLFRDEQLRQGVPGRERLPSDAAEFATVVKNEARLRAFKLVVRDAKAHFAESPETVKEFRRYLREGVVIEAGDVATITLKDVKDAQLNLRRVDLRWHLEDRKGPEPLEKK